MNDHEVKTTDSLTLHVRSYGRTSKCLPVICLHGLTRNAEDFADLAAQLSHSRKVYALDFRGRGRSNYDREWRNYVPPIYVRDVIDMMRALGLPKAVFCGTSLGGLVTMLLARQEPARVAAAILNDIGPVIETQGLHRIQEYTGTLTPVSSWDEACEQMRTIYGDSLPNISDTAWSRLVRRSYRETNTGQPILDFDPNIGRAIREVDMQLGDPWDLFDALRGIPTLVLRGELSDILSAATVDTMQQRHGELQRATILNRGHAPLLNELDSVAAIAAFLETVP